MTYKPNITVFCCENSVYETVLSVCKHHSNIQVIKVPCSGKISSIHILKCFESGKDMVIVIACIEEACHFINGNIRVEKVVEATCNMLKELDIEDKRLQILNFAPNMEEKFCSAFEDVMLQASKLGPMYEERWKGGV
ncbi:hydrogenase iron-sulfur subunit [bacterium]|nr:hydrogenase iron-sulfur subunit [bacterium]